MTTLLRRPEPEAKANSPQTDRGRPRPIGRRRPLPSGRAVAGAFLVAAAATLVLTAWLGATSTHGQRWVVARHALAAGTRITSDDLTTEVMTLPSGPTQAGAFRTTDALDGQILAAALPAGELVQQGALVPAGQQPELRPVTVTVDAADASDLVVGTVVDVLVTEGTGTRTTTSLVLRGAQVVEVASPGSSLVATSSGDDVTLGVATLAEVEAVVHASHTGTLSVVVGERSDGTGLGPSPAPAAEGATTHPAASTKAGS